MNPLDRRTALRRLAAGAVFGSAAFPGFGEGAAKSPTTVSRVSGGPKRIIFFLQNQGFDPATCIPAGMKNSGSLAGAKLPEGFRPDGLSLTGFLRGGAAPARESFYWELHEGATLQAARWGDWKAVRNGPGKAIEIYDLANDPGEQADLGRERPELVAKAEAIFKASRTEHRDWPLRSSRPGKKKSPAKQSEG
jgi:hypothetical protein